MAKKLQGHLRNTVRRPHLSLKNEHTPLSLQPFQHVYHTLTERRAHYTFLGGYVAGIALSALGVGNFGMPSNIHKITRSNKRANYTGTKIRTL